MSAQDRAVSAARSPAMPGEASMRALLFHMCSITGVKEEQLLSKYYREFERARWSVLGNGADLLLKRFSNNLSRNVDADGLGTAEVLDAIRRDEQYLFVRNTSYKRNVLLLYRSKSFRNRTMLGFFRPLMT